MTVEETIRRHIEKGYSDTQIAQLTPYCVSMIRKVRKEMTNKKVYLIWKTVERTNSRSEKTKVMSLVEIHSDVDRAWDKHIELNRRRKDNVSFSIEVWEVKG